MRTGKIKNKMMYSESGTSWLAGQELRVLEIDMGEEWEDAIVKVEGINRSGKKETAWIHKNDILLYQGGL